MSRLNVVESLIFYRKSTEQDSLQNMPDASSGSPLLDRWLTILEDEPDRVSNVPILHHYTDSAGLYGIVSSSTLWATAAQFSNDLSEIEYAHTVAHGVVEDVWKQNGKLVSWERLLYEHVLGLFAAPFPDFNQPFLVSFCESGDLLSQWRAYGHRGGFSLAFSPLDVGDSVLLHCEKGFRTLLRQVIYEPDRQRARLRFILENFIALVNGLPTPPVLMRTIQSTSSYRCLSFWRWPIGLAR